MMYEKRKSRTGQDIALALLIVLAAYCLFPIFMALLNSFKTKPEMFTDVMAFPQKFSVENYARSFRKMKYLASFFNNLVIVAIGMGGIAFFSAMAGWAMCRTKTKLSGFLFGLFVFSMLIPFNSIMIPLYRIAGALHLTNSTVGMGVIYIGLGVGMAIFMYHGFAKSSIPLEIEEAACIDGCGMFATFFLIVMPLLGPITATICIMNILWMWNDFLLPLIMLQSPKNYTLLLSTNMLFGQYSSDWPAILSALVLAVIPVVVLYAFLQKNILQGIVNGAVKS